jgi:PAS domain S-box-containing protein
LERTRDYMHRMKSGEIADHTCEKRYIRKDGGIVWCRTTLTLIKDPAGAPQRFIGVIEDITARKRAEQALVESEERFARFMQHLPGLAWIKDAEGRYVFVNDAAEKAFRTPRAQLYGKTDAEIFPPKFAEQFTQNDRRALAGAAGVQAIEVLEHEDGVLHHSLVNKFPIPAPDENSSLVGGIAIDVTEQKRAEEALAGNEARLRALVESAADAIITIDHRGLIEAINPAAERMFGYRPSEIIGRNVRSLMPEPYRGEHDGYIANYLQTGRARIIGIGREVEGLRKDGTTFPMELAVSEFRVGEQRYFTGIVRDITDRKLAELQLREADRRKDEFLATLAHELRNPIAPIRNTLEILKRAESSNPTQHDAYFVIERQLNQLVRLVDDLLDVSRISRNRLELRLERTDLARVIQQAIETCQPMIDAFRHRVELDLPREPIFLSADPVRLAQVFGNLLHNACKYTPPGGRVSVRAERVGQDVCVVVADSGVGISPDILPNVFDMFAQANSAIDHSQGGLGIGLTLVKRLVELHGGSVTASSDGQGRGSQFTVRLPLITSSPAAAPIPPLEPKTKASPARRILVVDDNRDSAKSLAMLLKVLGHETHVAHDGLEALERADALQPEVVLLDIGLPKMNGYDVCREIRQRLWGKTAVIVALTGWGQEEDRRKSKDAGFDRHLTKPAELKVLVSLLADFDGGNELATNGVATAIQSGGPLAEQGSSV